MTDELSGLTFGSVLSALSNGLNNLSSDESSSSIIADQTLLLERRLKAQESEIAVLKNVNRLQKDKIETLELGLEEAKLGRVDGQSGSKNANHSRETCSKPSLALDKSHSNSVTTNQPTVKTSPSSSSQIKNNAKSSDEFTRDLQNYYETRCRNLEKMVLEMHRWFSDYDLVWVGENEKDEAEAMKELTDDQLSQFEAANAHLNLDALVDAFPNGDDAIMGKAFKDDDDDDSTGCLDIFWFANGLKISTYPLMRYDDETWGRQTLEEIAEGFLPSRLQFDFPNGVDLKSRDRRRFVFDDEKERKYPSVRELRAKGLLPSAEHPGLESHETRQRKTGQFKPSAWSHGSRVRPKSSASKYLERVPKMVIDKDGEIRRPREGLEKMLTGRSMNETLSSASVSKTSTTKMGLTSKVVPIRIRVYHRQDDKQVLRVHLRHGQTIGELKRICETKLGLKEGAFDRGFDLVSDAEMRKYEMSETDLRSPGLKVWKGTEMTVGEAGWLRPEVDDDAPIKEKLVCLHTISKS